MHEVVHVPVYAVSCDMCMLRLVWSLVGLSSKTVIVAILLYRVLRLVQWLVHGIARLGWWAVPSIVFIDSRKRDPTLAACTSRRRPR
jgi:hypothetical protein